MKACGAVAREASRTWPKGHGGTKRRIKLLDNAIKNLTSGFRRALRKQVPAQRPRTSGGSRPLTPLQKWRENRRAVSRLQSSLIRIQTGEGSVEGTFHKRAVGNVQNLLPRFKGCRHDDVAGLQSLLLSVGTPPLPPPVDGESGDMDQDVYRNMVFNSPGGTGRFVKEFLRDAPSGTLDHATRPDGSKTWDPDEYKPIIRDVVRKPLSVKVDLPRPFRVWNDEYICQEEPTVDSTDARSTGCRPEWWDRTYCRSAKDIPDGVFGRVMDATTCAEVLELGVRSSDGGKAAGHDGCDIDLWKLIAFVDGGGPSPGLAILTRIVNDCLSLNHIPPSLKHGWITMVPKPRADGTSTTEAGEMRPITVLPEIGKVISRILASRLQDILALHPKLISSAQRGFLRDGSADQCVDVVLDVIEDWNNTNRRGDLYLMGYDQAKAYDSVQEYTIRASLERFNMPERFIEFVVSGLKGATSCVRTAGGLTAPFVVQSGVRQGDPLAPLIFLFVTDALHEGLKQPGWGYEVQDGSRSGEGNVRSFSSGYADDAIAFATSPKAMLEMHEWVRAFFGAHCFELNCKKTELVCSAGRGSEALAGKVRSVCGVKSVDPKPPNHTIRYLGVWINIRGTWGQQVGRMDRSVHAVCSSIRRGFTIPMSVFTITQFLIPRLRMGLRVAKISKTKLASWDTRIRQAVQGGDQITMSGGSSAFHLVSGIPSMVDQCLTFGERTF